MPERKDVRRGQRIQGNGDAVTGIREESTEEQDGLTSERR
jgi:hypothetical protein